MADIMIVYLEELTESREMLLEPIWEFSNLLGTHQPAKIKFLYISNNQKVPEK